MKLGTGQLAALVAVIREGSFDRAARRLHLTASAVSQRIKQLEEQVGTILVVRSSPSVATPTGEAVYRHALQLEVLEKDLMQSVTPGAADDPLARPMQLAIAVNADTLATWLVPALRDFSARNNVRIDVKIADEDDTAQWLRSGKAVGVVTSEARPLQGCRVQPLGVMRYRATASPRFVRRWLPDGATVHALRAAPSLAYNRKDELCEQFLSESPSPVDTDADTDTDADAELHAHFLPSPNAHVQACLEGLGWGMNPQPLVASLIKRRRLVDLSPQRTVDVALYWQQWSISSTSVDALACSLREHAQQALTHDCGPS